MMGETSPSGGCLSSRNSQRSRCSADKRSSSLDQGNDVDERDIQVGSSKDASHGAEGKGRVACTGYGRMDVTERQQVASMARLPHCFGAHTWLARAADLLHVCIVLGCAAHAIREYPSLTGVALGPVHTIFMVPARQSKAAIEARVAAHAAAWARRATTSAAFDCLARRVAPQRQRLPRCKSSPGVQPGCGLRLASTAFAGQRAP